MPYLTPDSVPTGKVCRTISIPDSLEWFELVNGALSELTKAYNYEKFGTLTPDETAEAAQTIFWDYHGSECTVIPIGAMMMFSKSDGTVPAKWLWCDGAAVSRATYADLFAEIGTQYGAGNGTTTFNIPDTRGYFLRSTVLQSAAEMGNTGGQSTITLGLANLPAHHHTVSHANAAGTSVNFAPGSATGLSNQNTSDVGSATPIATVPPYKVFSVGIYAGV